MTFRPDQIGDHGQRWEIRYRIAGEMEHRVVGWAGDLFGAKAMAEAWRQHPDGEMTWIVDRNKTAPPPP